MESGLMKWTTCTLFGSQFCFQCDQCKQYIEKESGLMIAYEYQGDNYSYCAECSHVFWFGETVFYSKHEYRNLLCQQCSERENMVQTKILKITAEVDGKQVPLETVSTETFEAIKALEKPKEIPVARLVKCGTSPRLLFRPKTDIKLELGKIYALDLYTGTLAMGGWLPERDIEIVRINGYKQDI